MAARGTDCQAQFNGPLLWRYSLIQLSLANNSGSHHFREEALEIACGKTMLLHEVSIETTPLISIYPPQNYSHLDSVRFLCQGPQTGHLTSVMQNPSVIDSRSISLSLLYVRFPGTPSRYSSSIV